MFSSTLFIGTLSAIGIISRYAASAVVCRWILLFELAGLSGAEDAGEQEPAFRRDHIQLEDKVPKAYQNPAEY